MVTYRHKNNSFIDLLLRLSWPILIIWSAGLIFSAFFLIRFLFTSAAPIDNSVSVWFQQNDPELVKYLKYNNDFGEAEWTMLLLETQSIEDDEFLNQLETLTEEIELVPHVQKAISLANIQTNFIKPDGKHQYKPLYRIYDDVFNKDTNIKTLLAQMPALDGTLFRSGDDQHTVIFIKNDNLIRTQTKYRVVLLDSVRALAGNKSTITDHALAGTTVINAELNRAAAHDAVLFYFLVSGLLVLFTIITLRNWRDSFILIAIVMGTIVPVMGGLAFFKIPYNMITIMLPTLLIAFSVADIVHVIDLFHKLRQSGSVSIESSLGQTIRELWKPGLWTSVTTAVGLAALSRSDVIPVYQIGVMGPAGILLAWVQTMTCGPVLLRLLWRSHEPSNSGADTRQGWYQRMINWMIGLSARHPRKLIAGFFIMVLPLLALPRLEVDTNYADFFRSGSTIPVAYSKVKEAGFSQNPLSLMLTVENSRDITSPGIYTRVRMFEKKIQQLYRVNSILSATPLLEEIDKTLLQLAILQPGRKRLEHSRMTQILQAADMTGNQDIDDFISPDRRQIQIMALTGYLSSKELLSLKTEIQEAASECFTNGDVSLLVTGTTSLWAGMDKHISDMQLQSILIVFCFMAFFLPIIFKSLRLGILGLVINFLPVSIALGVMALYGIKVNIATALIGSIAFGVVVDDTIHFITRLNNNRVQGLTIQESITDTLEIIGHSIITTTLILVGSFITLSSSSFLPISHFGIFIAFSVSLALYLDVFILPLLAGYFYPERATI